MILGGTEFWLFLGMGAIIIGNGYFKANISTIVGRLYKEGDPRRDSGFTIFYMGINVGALLATVAVSPIGETYGFLHRLRPGGRRACSSAVAQFYLRRRSTARGTANRRTPSATASTACRSTWVSLLAIPAIYALINWGTQHHDPGPGPAVLDPHRAAGLRLRHPAEGGLQGRRRAARPHHRAVDPDGLQRGVLGLLRAGGQLADPVRRPQRRPRRVRPVHHAGQRRPSSSTRRSSSCSAPSSR